MWARQVHGVESRSSSRATWQTTSTFCTASPRTRVLGRLAAARGSAVQPQTDACASGRGECGCCWSSGCCKRAGVSFGREPTPVGDTMAAPAPSTPVMIPARGRELERRPAAPVPGASLPVAHRESAGRRLLSPLLAACASNDLQLVRYAIERDLHSVDQSDEWCVARRQPGAKSGLPASSEILTPCSFCALDAVPTPGTPSRTGQMGRCCR